MDSFDVSYFIELQKKAIRDALGDRKALVAVSGGVDSTVSALITHRAIGDNLICVFIDDNFMRLGEAEQVKKMLTNEPLKLPLRIVNERQRFMEALLGLADAEEKRKVFRETFYQTLRNIAIEEDCHYLVQGTIKADVDETSVGIKTQHNILEQIGINPVERYGFQVIEPLKSIYKYQVREIARSMQIPSELAERQPFPGPGLSIRVVGEVTGEKLEELKKATFIVEEQLNPYNPSQYFAAIFSGVELREINVLPLDGIELIDFSHSNFRSGILTEKATGIVKGKRMYGSVLTLALLDDSGQTIEPNYDQLVKVRDYVFDNYPETSRLLVLVDKRDSNGYALSIRAVKTKDFLKASVVRLPWTSLLEASVKIFDACPRLSRVYYDITPKPPATIEYE
jgi:GMP synthase (glutamine-hydrolysing)